MVTRSDVRVDSGVSVLVMCSPRLRLGLGRSEQGMIGGKGIVQKDFYVTFALQ